MAITILNNEHYALCFHNLPKKKIVFPLHIEKQEGERDIFGV